MKYDLIYKNPGSVEKVEADTMAEAIAAKTDERDPFMVVATKTVTTEGEPYEALVEKPGRVRIISKWSVDGTDPNDKTKIIEADTILEALGGSSGVKKPVFSVPSGDIGKGETVEITCETEGAVIYYTTDGSTPTSKSTQYSAPIEITDDVTIKAIAILDESTSKIATAEYHVVLPTVATPVITPASGNVAAGTKATITCATDGATIYYTTDGSAPTTGSIEYTAEIEITDGMKLRAIAVKSNYTNSSVASANYSIVLPSYWGWIYGTEWGTDESRIADIKAMNSGVQNSAEFTFTYVGDAKAEDGAFITYVHPISLGTTAHCKDKVQNINYDNSVTFSEITIDGALYQICRFTNYNAPDIGDKFYITWSDNPIA